MKAENGVIEIIVLVFIILCIVGLISMVGIIIKQEADYGTKEGQVIDKKYTSAYTTIMRSGSITVPQYHPENYAIKIQKEVSEEMKSIWINVDKETYHKINVGDYYNENKTHI